MKKKILGLFVCVLLIATIPVVGALNRIVLQTTNPSSYLLEMVHQNQIPKLLTSDDATRDLVVVDIFLLGDTTLNDDFSAHNSKWSDYEKLGDRDNKPPVFGTPSPGNNSINNPLSFFWNILIEDIEGNLFSWYIECDNGQKNKSNGDGNGTKSLELSGLAYSTTYTIWVNATDEAGSGLWNRSWYNFTTEQENHSPEFGAPSPTNSSTDNPINLNWSILISDPEGNSFTWTIQCSNGQDTSGSGASNGTKFLELSSLTYETNYMVWVNATDPGGSGIYTRRWYTFATKVNQVVVFGSTIPTNGSTNQPLSLTWIIPINDPEGDQFSWSIQCSNGQFSNGIDEFNATKTLPLSDLSYSTTYTIWVNATDEAGSGLWNRSWYTFTTEPENHSPEFGTPSPTNSSTNNPINLTWSIPINDLEGNTFTWTIQCNNGQSNNSVIGETNGTKKLTLSDLANGTTYTVWVNATDSGGSGVYTRRWYTFTTKGNQPPIFGSATPSNGSTNNPLSLTWIIPINDPDGDNFNWTIQCSNGQVNSGGGAFNGTKTLILSSLAYKTNYRVWVNATDPDGSGQYTRRWYTFKTSNPGGPPPEEPPGSSNKNPVADASAREPYQGSINSTILFDGSLSYDPDGNSITYLWDFGDNTNANGMAVYHSFLEAGTYTITLTVTDNKTATDTDTTTCVIKQSNRSPTKPTITGPTSGTKNTVYTYTAASTDPDKDPLLYTFEWGGSISQLSGFLPNGMNYSVNHSWTTAGRYNLTVTVTDNQNRVFFKDHHLHRCDTNERRGLSS